MKQKIYTIDISRLVNSTGKILYEMTYILTFVICVNSYRSSVSAEEYAFYRSDNIHESPIHYFVHYM